MKSDTTNSNWKPTLTLAKLFEEQNQFYDALSIYEILGQTDNSPLVREKIETLQSRILSDPNMKYDERIEKLFSPEELAYLKIMNHSAFENLSRIQAQFIDGASDYEVVLEDEEPVVKPTVSSFEVRRMVDEIDTLSTAKLNNSSADNGEASISDLVDKLIKQFGKDSKLSDISVQDFMKVVLDYNLAGKSDKK